jgi:hypothetical protein
MGQPRSIRHTKLIKRQIVGEGLKTIRRFELAVSEILDTNNDAVGNVAIRFMRRVREKFPEDDRQRSYWKYQGWMSDL